MFKPTTEQLRALELFATGESLAIEAGAGTGKTSTLKLLAESTPRRGQYIAFNKAIVTEAGEKMPGTVNCSTAHSLAYRAVGHRYGKRLRNSQRMRSIEIARRLGIDPLVVTDWAGEKKSLSSSYLAGLTMQAVVRFCQSADPEPTFRHCPYIEGLDDPNTGKGDTNRAVGKWIETAMRRAWADLTDPDGTLPFKHDHYLKLWQLSDPKIAADYILFDEAQDANPVMVAIVAAQEHAQLVWVGDSQQQIYTFTGAVNALQRIPAQNRTFLTQSFRFGPAVAEMANDVLERLEAELRVVGTDSIASVVAPVATPDVVLTRTNAAAMREVFNAMAAGMRPHLVGGGKDIISFARAAERLMNGQKVEHPELACFDTWTEVQEYVAQDEQGGDLRLLVSLVDQFGTRQILNALERMPREQDADLIVSTAHKSKGREWASVQLGGDFPAEPKGEELRLLYVAITRARLELDITGVGLFNEAPPEATTNGKEQ
jgi:hypothetical protein